MPDVQRYILWFWFARGAKVYLSPCIVSTSSCGIFGCCFFQLGWVLEVGFLFWCFCEFLFCLVGLGFFGWLFFLMEGVSRSLVLSGAKMILIVHFRRVDIFLLVVGFGFCFVVFFKQVLETMPFIKEKYLLSN